MPSFFVTGTDTEVGKTLMSAALLYALCARGMRTAAMKPVAAGAEQNSEGQWENDDTRQLARAANISLPLERITPYALKAATAPHIAAMQQAVDLDIERIARGYAEIARAADCVIVEGVGGFCVPLDPHRDTADLARALDLPMILVVGLRLGCLNHALLTAEAIGARGLKLAGWIANRIDPMLHYADEMIDALEERLNRLYQAPLLGVVPYLHPASASAAAPYLNLEPLGFQ